MEPREALETLLLGCFQPHELRRFLRALPGQGTEVVQSLPEQAGVAQTVTVAVGALVSRGMVDADFFDRWTAARPKRASEIRNVQQAWPSDATPLLRRLDRVVALESRLLDRERYPRGLALPGDLQEHIHTLAQGLRRTYKRGDHVAGTELQRVIGGGNFGSIWLATDLETGETRATKVMHLDKLAEGVMLWRFRRSIVAMQRLTAQRDAPSTIVCIRGVADDELAFSMDFMKGGNLEKAARFGWDLATKLDRFLEVCRAVQFAHDNGIIHRDIKPGNVVLTEEGEPVLTDFDISDIKFVTQLSVANKQGLGTPVFAAPEQLEEGDQATERSDIYSLGRLLYFLLLGRSPGYQVERDPQLENLAAFPAPLVAVVRRATQIDPLRRYASVDEMVADLRAYGTWGARFRATTTLAARWVRRNAALLSVFGVVALSLTGFAVFQSQAAKREAELNAALQAAIVRLDEAIGDLDAFQRQKDTLRGVLDEARARAAALRTAEASGALSAEQAEELRETEARMAQLEERIREIDAQAEAIRQQLEDQRRHVARLEDQRRADEDGGAASPAPPVAPSPGPGPATPADAALAQPSENGIVIDKRCEGSEGAVWCRVAPSELCGPGPCLLGSEWGRINAETLRDVPPPPTFWLLQTEVTQVLWADVRTRAAELGLDTLDVPANPSRFQGGQLPVEQVSWCDVARFANLWTLVEAKQTGRTDLKPVYTTGRNQASLRGCGEKKAVTWHRDRRGFRLPTEDEWEIATRAGTDTRFTSGNSDADLAAVAWYKANSDGTPHPVAQLNPNALGLYDVHGNVWEWTWSRSYGEESRSLGAWRVLRGGSFDFEAQLARSAYRVVGHPISRNPDLGFRLVRSSAP